MNQRALDFQHSCYRRRGELGVAKHCFIIMPFSEASERHTEAYGATFFTEFLTVFTDLSTRAEGPGIE
jgi:hypothetical protein